MEPTVIQVVFNPQQSIGGYSYFTDFENHFVGQKVVVFVGGDCKVVTVSNVKPTAEQKARAEAWIVQPIDLETHLNKMEKRNAKR